MVAKRTKRHDSYLGWRNVTDEDILYVLKADRHELPQDLANETGIGVTSIGQIRRGTLYAKVYPGIERIGLYPRKNGCATCHWFVRRGKDNGKRSKDRGAAPAACGLGIKEFEEMGCQAAGAECVWFTPKESTPD